MISTQVTSKDKKLLDLAGCSVVRGTDRGDGVFGGAFAFAVIAEDGSRLCLQAENEDERLRWVSALRRATGAPLNDFASIGAFQAENSVCAECASDEADWVSCSVGVALCADCAAAHRRLGGDFGRLRALSLDAWSPLVLDYLLQSAGNERAREVWEAVGPPTGWSRPAWKSKFYGAFVLNHRVVLHAIEATPARWRGDAGSSPLDRARTAASSPRNDLAKNCAPDTLVDLHTGLDPHLTRRRTSRSSGSSPNTPGAASWPRTSSRRSRAAR